MKYNPHLGEFDSFFEKNKQIIKEIIKRHFMVYVRTKKFEYDDFFQEGSIGFIKAYEGYEPQYGYTFSTYAFPMVWGYISNLIQRAQSIIRTPRIKKGEQLKPKIVVSGNKKISSESGKIELFDTLSISDDEGELFVREFERELTEREKLILKNLVGGAFQKDIGKMIGVSQVQVFRIINQKIKPKMIKYFQLEVAQ